MHHKRLMLMLALLLILGGEAEARRNHQNEADRCVAGKLRAVGDALSCRLDEEARQIRHHKPARFDRCDRRFKKKIDKLADRFGNACPYLDDAPDLSSQNAVIIDQVYDAIEDGDYDLSVEWPPNPCEPLSNDLKRPENGDWGRGAYSAQCNVMLYRAAQRKDNCGPQTREQSNWMVRGAKQLAYALAKGCPENEGDCQEFFTYPQSDVGDPSGSDEEKEEFLNNIFRNRRTEFYGERGNPARVIQRYFWKEQERSEWAPETTAKSLGVATDYGTYVGVYNCDSKLQRDRVQGCKDQNPIFGDFFVGAMVHPAPSIAYKPDSSNPNDRYPGLSPDTATIKDCSTNREGKAPTRSCNFNVFKPVDPEPGLEPVDNFDWAERISKNGFLGEGALGAFGREHPFAVCDRGWYQYALQQSKPALPTSLGEPEDPVFKSVYQNFVTGHPIFGFVMRYNASGSEEPKCCDGSTEACRLRLGNGAGVVLALEYVEDARAVTQWKDDPSWRGCQVECCVAPNGDKDPACTNHNIQETFESAAGPGAVGRTTIEECEATRAFGDSQNNCVWQCGTPAEPLFPDSPLSLDTET